MPERDHDHSAEGIAARIGSVNHNYLRDWIYGGIDGSVTTFAVVAGVVGANLPIPIILILGFANLIADGFSMAASNYLGTRAEQDDYKRLEAMEYRHIEKYPEGEKEEIRHIYREKGFEGEDLERAVELITSDKERWVKTMLTEEYGLPSEIRSAWKAAASTFLSFFICGMIPLLPYLSLSGSENSFIYASAFTGVTFFLIGSFKSFWSTVSWFRSGIETLIVGGLAATLAYGVGVLLRGLGLE